MPAPAMRALVHADVEALRRRDAARSARIACCVNARELGDLVVGRGRCSRRRGGTGRPCRWPALYGYRLSTTYDVLAARDDEARRRRRAPGDRQNGHSSPASPCVGLFSPRMYAIRCGVQSRSHASAPERTPAPRRPRRSDLHARRDGVDDLGDRVVDRDAVLLRRRRGSGTTPRPRRRPRRRRCSMYGTFCFCALRIFFCMRSSEVSTSTRMPCVAQLRGDLVQVVDVLVGDRDADHLHGRQPRRERTRVVLEQHGEEALDRAEQRAVDHHRTLARAVGAPGTRGRTAPAG